MAAAKLAFFAPAATVTAAGTDTALLLLARVTANPLLGAAAVRVTVQLSLPAPSMEELEQLIPEREAGPDPDPPWPCNRTVPDHHSAVAVLLWVETLSSAVVSTAAVGSK